VRPALLIPLLIGCGRSAAPPSEPPIVEVDPSSVAVVTPGEIDTGPLVTGTLRPTREAALRAEVSGTVVEAPPDAGTPVKAGQLLVRFDDRALKEAERSARSALHSARLAEALALRDVSRYEHLAKVGAAAPRDAETAAQQRVAARAAVSDAAARLSSAKNTLDRARVRAPFAGVISTRAVKAGDIVQPGTPLVTVIDPATLRLEAAVPAERIGEIAAGQRVDFAVTGYENRRFEGKIQTVSPAIDPATGQVAVTATLANSERLVAGLHAEGRVLTQSKTGLIVPLAAIDRRRLTPEVLRLRDGVVERLAVKLGLIDDVNQRALVVSGLAPGDVILVGAAREIAPGTRVRVADARVTRR
jgi:RND family efflux transporter MFP subunit